MYADGGAWHLDRDPDTLLEPMLPPSPTIASREAVRNILNNKENLINFALRAVGTRGQPRVSAPLADPNAIPNTEYILYIDLALRYISMSLLTYHSEETGSGTGGESGEGLLKNGGVEKWENVEETELCLYYIRDRISVPRDMSIHAARLFRAHINMFVDVIRNV